MGMDLTHACVIDRYAVNDKMHIRDAFKFFAELVELPILFIHVDKKVMVVGGEHLHCSFQQLRLFVGKD